MQKPKIQQLADWQLPSGVTRATWDYVNDAAIATEYDKFHATHGLLDFDQSIVHAEVDRLNDRRPALVLDLGCGTGRSLVYAHQQGHRVLGVDLSAEMLRCAHEKLTAQCKSDADRARVQWMQANMVELQPIESQSVDLALCLYSSIGMVRGLANRANCMQHVQRVLKPGGRFVVHVHNRQNWWLTAMGRKLIWKDLIQACVDRQHHECGDRFYSYRNLPSMFLHVFTKTELRRLLQQSGFQIEQWIHLDQSSTKPLSSSWWLPRLRSAGFLVTALVR